MAVSVRDRERVRAQAEGRCEYCRMANDWEPFFPYHVEHIVPRQHRGSDELPNLALSCHHCNLVKGPNLTSIDPDTGMVTELFHPRLQIWNEHFRLEGDLISGITDVGRTTVFLLRMNAPHRIELRAANPDK